MYMWDVSTEVIQFLLIETVLSLICRVFEKRNNDVIDVLKTYQRVKIPHGIAIMIQDDSRYP